MVVAVVGCGDNTPGIVVDAPLGSEPLGPAMLAASPGSVDFGTTSASTSALASLTVTNLGQTASGPVMIRVTGSHAALFSTVGMPCPTLAPAAMCMVSLRFAPTTPGAAEAQLEISASPGGLLMIPLAGTGVTGPGGLSVNPSSHNFGSVQTGTTSASATFTITNAGGVTSGALTVTPGGTNPTDFAISSQTCSGAMLAPGANCTYDVQFTPIAGGARTASFVVAASPGGSTTTSVTGIGQ